MDAVHTTQVSGVAQQRTTALWLMVVLLAVIATTLLVRDGRAWSPPPVLADNPAAGTKGVFAFTGQLDRNRYGLFMVDVESSNLWCYEYLPGTRKLKLVAARSFRADRYLEDYANDEPTPSQVQAMLKDQSRIENRLESGGTALPAGDDEDALGTSIPGVAP